ncbi:hypothetical protein TNCV_734721 [Trichonephila clavipes]|nr:hypothetical protein TNCV_734721 [Trichonephila clavipes]
MLSWLTPGFLVLVEETMKVVDYLRITVNLLHSNISYVFPTGNRIFQQDKRLECQKTRIELEGFEEHKDEFQSISWPFNSAQILI